MSYVVRPHPSDVAQQIDALPTTARGDFERTLAEIAAAPWAAPALRHDNPDAEVRVEGFGPDVDGMIVYLILERERAIQVELIIWLSG